MLTQYSNDNAVVALYGTMRQAEGAIRSLYSARVPPARMSLIGRDDTQPLPVAERQSRYGAWGLLSSSLSIGAPGLGLIRAVGFFTSQLTEARSQCRQGRGHVAIALNRLGLSTAIAQQLEAEITAGHWLVIVRGDYWENAKAERYLYVLQGGASIVHHSNSAAAAQPAFQRHGQ